MRYFRVRFFICAVLSLFIFTGCGTGKKAVDRPITEIPLNIPEGGYQPSPQYGQVPLDSNKHVDQWIKYFTGRGRSYMQTYLERSARYIPLMKATFRERGMPDELAYIAMIESGFSPTAFSHASAVGYWQFIRETGKRYNLRIDQFVDERRDPILSTQSAASYLDSLYSIFGDWHLSLSAYNAGERRILRAVMKYQTRNFWELSRIRRALPRETDNYIPKYIAAVMIAKNPGQYGFFDIDFQPAFSFESVVIEKPISLELLSRELNVPFEELKRMNPRYKSDYVPVYTDRVNAVRVPIGMKDLAIAALPKILTDAPAHFTAEFDYYKVRRGDTLSHIARRYRTSVPRLRDLNNFSSRTLIRIGQKIKIPDNNGFVVKNKTKGTRVLASGEKFVASGEKLSKTEAINTQSNNTQSKIKPVSRKKAVSNSGQKTVSNSKVHVVRRGENLSTIARKYRTSVAQLTRVNSLRSSSKIMVGTELVIPN